MFVHVQECAPTPLDGQEVSSKSSSFGSILNPSEVVIVRTLLHGLASNGYDTSKVGVLSPYRSQVSAIKESLSHMLPSVEVSTIDRFQGRDTNVSIISTVRSQIADSVLHSYNAFS